jgi:hypothetical protein
MRLRVRARRPAARTSVALTVQATRAADARAQAEARGYEVLSVAARRSSLAATLKLFSEELLVVVSAAATAVILLLTANVVLLAIHLVTALCDMP